MRALALRTLSYIHVKHFVDATVGPLKSLLKDGDPYVRKTAAFCVAKLYDHDRALVEEGDLIDRLNNMLRDDNPTVISSALAALMDIWERSETIKLTIDYKNASNIVHILPDCSEYVWCLTTAGIPADFVVDGARRTSLRRSLRTSHMILTKPLRSPNELPHDSRIQIRPSC